MRRAVERASSAALVVAVVDAPALLREEEREKEERAKEKEKVQARVALERNGRNWALLDETLGGKHCVVRRHTHLRVRA